MSTPEERARQRLQAIRAWAEARRLTDAALPPPASSPRRPIPPSLAQIRAVRRMLEEHSYEVAGLSRPAFAVMLPLLEEAKREVARDLAAWLERHSKDGAERYTGRRYSSQLAALQGGLAAIGRLAPGLEGALEGVRQDTAQMATGHVVSEVSRMLAVFDEIDFRPRVEAAAIIALGERLFRAEHRTTAARYAGAVETDLRAELAKGMLRGETVGEMTDRLVRLGGPRGYVALRGVAGEQGSRGEVIAEGLFRRYRFWAERIVRDQVATTYTAQALAGYFETRRTLPDLKKRWDASVDRRTCKECAALDGTVVDLEALFPGGVEGAPLHSCCRCRTGAWRDHWSKYMREAEELEKVA